MEENTPLDGQRRTHDEYTYVKSHTTRARHHRLIECPMACRLTIASLPRDVAHVSAPPGRRKIYKNCSAVYMARALRVIDLALAAATGDCRH